MSKTNKTEKIVAAEAGEATFTGKDETFEFSMGEQFTPSEVVIDFSKIKVEIWKDDKNAENSDTRID